MATKRTPIEIVAAARRHIARINAWTSTFDAQAYAANELVRYACERAFIAIGEAMRDLGGKTDLVSLFPDGPWADPVRFRNFLAHDYDDQAVPALVWRTIITDLPDLDSALAVVEAQLRADPAEDSGVNAFDSHDEDRDWLDAPLASDPDDER